MERKFIKELKWWKDNDILKPLMIVGARQIGKTYLINNFCLNNFSDYIYINLMEREDIIKIFEEPINISEKVEKLKYALNREIYENTVIFIDEIQESENLISSLKYFCEDKFPYKIICAGSLLGVKLKRFSKSFPVGKVTILKMYPMDFEEFLIATDNKMIIKEIKSCFQTNNKINEQMHQKLLKFYRYYLITGGMPEVVQKFITNDLSILSLDTKLLDSIIDSYIVDMKKYTYNNFETVKIEKVYKNIPSQLAKENKKFQYGKLEKNARKRDYETSVDWLISSNLILPCYYVNKFETPLKGFANEDNFKLYLNDVGILTRILEIPYNKIMLDDNFMYKGVLAENYVAENLIANGYSIYYWSVPSQTEIDFLIDTHMGIIPIEVKASSNVSSKSLNKYVDKYKPNYAIRISTKNFGFENNIKSVPLYAVFCINENYL